MIAFGGIGALPCLKGATSLHAAPSQSESLSLGESRTMPERHINVAPDVIAVLKYTSGINTSNILYLL
jgi:hypothetical protein